MAMVGWLWKTSWRNLGINHIFQNYLFSRVIDKDAWIAS